MSASVTAKPADDELSTPHPSLTIYSTLSKRKEPFRTVRPGKGGVYLCGPTVYDKAHIGHMVGPVIFDCIKRYLKYCGYDAIVIQGQAKTLSYLCAGRPILGLMPGDNLASTLVTLGGGCVLPPTSESLDEAAKWVASVVSDPTLTAEISDRSRSLAELDFNLASCTDKFEKILARQLPDSEKRARISRPGS